MYLIRRFSIAIALFSLLAAIGCNQSGTDAACGAVGNGVSLAICKNNADGVGYLGLVGYYVNSISEDGSDASGFVMDQNGITTPIDLGTRQLLSATTTMVFGEGGAVRAIAEFESGTAHLVYWRVQELFKGFRPPTKVDAVVAADSGATYLLERSWPNLSVGTATDLRTGMSQSVTFGSSGTVSSNSGNLGWNYAFVAVGGAGQVVEGSFNDNGTSSHALAYSPD